MLLSGTLLLTQHGSMIGIWHHTPCSLYALVARLWIESTCEGWRRKGKTQMGLLWWFRVEQYTGSTTVKGTLHAAGHCRRLLSALWQTMPLSRQIPLEHLPRDLFMIGRSMMVPRGLAHALCMDFQVMHQPDCHAWSFQCMSDIYSMND